LTERLKTKVEGSGSGTVHWSIVQAELLKVQKSGQFPDFHFVCGVEEVSDLIDHPVLNLLDTRVGGTSAEMVTKRIELELFATRCTTVSL
jgi:hypothetical protein